MSDSFSFDFRKSPSFLRKWNKEFDVEDLENTTFKIILVNENCDNNIEDCLTDGVLKYGASDCLIEDCTLKYDELDSDNVNITLDGDVTFTINDPFQLKGAFITTSSKYVLGYSINTSSLSIYNEMIFKDEMVIWDIMDGVNHV